MGPGFPFEKYNNFEYKRVSLIKKKVCVNISDESELQFQK